MRNRLLRVLSALAVLAIVGVQHASAQGVIDVGQTTGFLVGPVGGLNIVSYNSAAFPIINQEASCFTAQNGNDVAPWGGVSLEFPLGDINNLQNFLVGEVLYDSKSSKFNQNSGSKTTTPTKLNGYTADGSVETALTAQLNYLLINLAYKYNFTPSVTPVGPGLQVGPSVGIRMASTFNKTVTVTASSGQASPATKTATLSQPSDVDGAQSLRIALRAQFTYDIPFTQSWIATPTVGYDFPITKVDATRDWRAQSIYGGIALRYFIKS